MKIEINEDNVMTLDAVAHELAPMYGWSAFEAHKDTIEFWAVDDKGEEVHGFVDEGGWARDPGGNDMDEWNVNFCEDLDLNDAVWAEDEHGNSVLLHN